MEKVARAIFDDADTQERFLRSIECGDHGISAVAWLKQEPTRGVIERHELRPSWLPEWVEVAANGTRPGSLLQHEAGDFYVLDLSSTFALAPLAEIAEPIRCIVDVCAAPGGKGILARRYCNPDVLIGNEVIRKRTAQLIANYKRCLIDPAIVTSCDPKLLARLLRAQGDLVVVDAPCSGQSLVLKGGAAPGAFHPATIGMNERRQRRILAESSEIVRPGGYLLYATCTFSPQENEYNVEWFCKKFPHFTAVEVQALSPYRSSLVELPTYRLSPHHGFGAGAFYCLLQRKSDGDIVERISLGDLTSVIWPVWSSASIQEQQESATLKTRASRR